MGIIADLLANAKTIQVGDPTYQYLDGRLNTKVDPAAPAGSAAGDAVHTVKQYASDPSAGTFTLTFSLASGESFTTAGIAYNANAATIESAIDTAATAASIAGWTNGDISVSGGTLLAAGADVVLTFDGSSVASANHDLTTIDGSGLTGGSLASPATVKTQPGQSARNALGVLEALGVLTGAYAEQRAAYNPAAYAAGPQINVVPMAAVRGLAREAVEEDDNWASYWSILVSLGIDQDKAPAQARAGYIYRSSY